jgi:hypothetical protein
MGERKVMITDCAIKIGTTHQICQDYAYAGSNFVILADGCSSSPETDIGARLITLAARMSVTQFRSLADAKRYYETSIRMAAYWATQMQILEQSLDSTLVTLHDVDDQILATLYGDGFLAWRTGEILNVFEVSYKANYPNYPSYILAPGRLKNMPPNNKMVVDHFQIGPTGISRPEFKWVDEMQHGFFYKSIPKEGVDFVAVITDGAKSFFTQEQSETGKQNVNLEVENVMADLIGFKNLQEGFVQRRLQRFEKDALKKNLRHYDDLSIGAIALKG